MPLISKKKNRKTGLCLNYENLTCLKVKTAFRKIIENNLNIYFRSKTTICCPNNSAFPVSLS